MVERGGSASDVGVAVGAGEWGLRGLLVGAAAVSPLSPTSNYTPLGHEALYVAKNTRADVMVLNEEVHSWARDFQSLLKPII